MTPILTYERDRIASPSRASPRRKVRGEGAPGNGRAVSLPLPAPAVNKDEIYFFGSLLIPYILSMLFT